MISKIQNHFGFKSIPFTKEVSVNDLFKSTSIKQAHEYLHIAVESEDFALVSGSPGSGKSSAIRKFLNELDPVSYPQIYFSAEQYRIGDIAKIILHGFHCSVPHQGFKALRILQDYIFKINSEKGAKPVIVIDEAQELPCNTLRSIKNMANFNIDGCSRITFILCGQSELVNVLKSEQLTSLRRRIRIRYVFKPMTIEESLSYIDYHLKIAGSHKPIFTDDCKSEIFKLSQGNISNINNICFDLLYTAVREKKDIIEPSLMEHVLVD